MSQCSPVVPPDLPDILFPLLSHLVQMVRLHGVACQSPFGRRGVTGGLMAREGPPTSPAHGHWQFSKGARMRTCHPARGGKWRSWSWPKARHRLRGPGMEGGESRRRQHERKDRGRVGDEERVGDKERGQGRESELSEETYVSHRFGMRSCSHPVSYTTAPSLPSERDFSKCYPPPTPSPNPSAPRLCWGCRWSGAENSKQHHPHSLTGKAHHLSLQKTKHETQWSHSYSVIVRITLIATNYYFSKFDLNQEVEI